MMIPQVHKYFNILEQRKKSASRGSKFSKDGASSESSNSKSWDWNQLFGILANQQNCVGVSLDCSDTTDSAPRSTGKRYSSRPHRLETVPRCRFNGTAADDAFLAVHGFKKLGKLCDALQGISIRFRKAVCPMATAHHQAVWTWA